jgi:hypothetical protein
MDAVLAAAGFSVAAMLTALSAIVFAGVDLILHLGWERWLATPFVPIIVVLSMLCTAEMWRRELKV